MVSTVDPGRKTVSDGEENGDDLMNGDILPDIGVTIDDNKCENKLSSDEANGKTDKNEIAASKPIDETVSATESIAEASTSANGTTETSNGDANVVEPMVSEPDASNEIEKATEATETTTTASTSVVIKEIKVDEAAEAKPETTESEKSESKVESEPIVEQPSTDDTDKSGETKLDAEVVKTSDVVDESVESAKLADETKPEIEKKVDDLIKSTEAAVEAPVTTEILSDKKSDEKIAQIVDELETVKSIDEKPIRSPSEKHLREDDDEEDVEIQNAKKMKFESTEDNTPVVKVTEHSDEKIVEAKTDEPLKTENGSVDAATNEPITIEKAVSTENETVKPVDESPIETKTEEIVAEKVPAKETPEPTESVAIVEKETPTEPIIESLKELPVAEALDAIPENITDLIGAGILPSTLDVANTETEMAADATAAVVTPAASAPSAEVSADPQPVNQESMTVEDAETANAEKMDAAPITDDQMDVDESNSVDPMDL